MKTIHRVNKFGIVSITYGWDKNRKEYITNVFKAENDNDSGLIMAIGTLTSVIPHPNMKFKKQFKPHEMADIWLELDVPDQDILLLLAGLPV